MQKIIDISVKMIKRAIIACILLSFQFSCKKPVARTTEAKAEETVLEEIETKPVLQIGNRQIDSSTFEKEMQSYSFTNMASLDSSLQDFVYRQLLAQEAKARGFDKDPNHIDQIQSFRKMYVREYLKDSTEINKLIDITYDRLAKEVRAAHLFISLPKHASTKDTSFVYSSLMGIREKALEGSFDSLAQVLSHDKATREKGGDLGWFTALQMIYPIENTVYALNKSEISLPIRSENGYHLIQKIDERPFRGVIKARHIYKALPIDSPQSFKDVQRAEIDSIYVALQRGATFLDLCAKYSDATSENCELSEFFTGSRFEPEFQEVAYTLKEGEISKVISTKNGYHIIQIVEIKPLPSKVILKDYLFNKVTTDSRGDWLDRQKWNRIKKSIQWEENLEAANKLKSLVDTSLLNGNWQIPTHNQNLKLFTSKAGSISLNTFLEQMQERQKFDKTPNGYTLEMAVSRYKEQFERTELEKMVIENSGQWFPEIDFQIDLLETSLLSQRLLQEEVVEKSLQDTTGLNTFYFQNQNQFIRTASKQAYFVQSKTEDILIELANAWTQKDPVRLKRGIYPIYFSKNESAFSQEDGFRLSGLAEILQKNPTYLVEIGGHRDVAESIEVVEERMQKVVQKLQDIGIRGERILIKNYDNTALADQFDWTKNQRVSFQFFSRDALDLLPTLDPEKKSLTAIEKKSFTSEEYPFFWNLPLNETQITQNVDSTFTLVKIIGQKPEGLKTLKECYGEVLSMYQDYLENALKETLEKKFQVIWTEEQLNSLKNRLLNSLN